MVIKQPGHLYRDAFNEHTAHGIITEDVGVKRGSLGTDSMTGSSSIGSLQRALGSIMAEGGICRGSTGVLVTSTHEIDTDTDVI